MAAASGKLVPVWDPFVRIFHWTVAVAFFVAYFSEDLLTVHVWAGYAIGVLLPARIVWGFVGPERARFRDFLYPPGAAVAYMRDLIALRGRRYLGHSPGGAAMVFALLAFLLAIVATGLVLYAKEEGAGPLAALGIVRAERAADPAATLGEDEEEEHRTAAEPGQGEGIWEELHEVLANLTLVLVGFHVAGVLLASYAHHENLMRAMVTGRKRPEPG